MRVVPPQPGVIADVDLGHPPQRATRGDDEVAGHRDLQAAADREAVHPGDRDLVALLARWPSSGRDAPGA
jgi:hypothetical protein